MNTTITAVATTITTAAAPTATPFTRCPKANNTVISTSSNGAQYKVVCGRTFGTGFMTVVVVPTLEKCMEACETWSQELAKKFGACAGVNYRIGSGVTGYQFNWTAGLCNIQSAMNRPLNDDSVVAAIRLGDPTSTSDGGS